MRIAILADPLDNQSAGVHVFTREMVRALLRLRHGHELLLLRERIDPALDGARQIAVPNVHAPIGFASLRLFLWIPWILRRERVDVVIEPAHFGPFNVGRRVKRVTIIHDLTPILFPHLHRWHSQVLQRLFLPRILANADLVVANSDNTRRDIERVYPESRGRVARIYPGVDHVYQPTEDRAVLSRLGIEAPYFLSVGTIEPRKNLVTLMDAYRRFREVSPGRVQLVIAGGRGWKAQGFDQALAAHPFRADIRVLGFTPLGDMPALYSGALATVYPSLYEGFGLPLLESLACGTPVVTSRCSSLPEVAGAAGLYARPDDSAGFAGHLRSLACEPGQRAALAAHCAPQAARFSWDSFARELVQRLEGLVSPQGR